MTVVLEAVTVLVLLVGIALGVTLLGLLARDLLR